MISKEMLKLMEDSFLDTIFVCDECLSHIQGFERLSEHAKDISHRQFTVFKKTNERLNFA